MKFRRLVFALILAVIIFCYFTKPTEEDFKTFIQPSIYTTHIPPSINYQDKILYAKVITTYVDINHPVKVGSRTIAPSYQEEYIGIFKKYWKIKK